ncbi:MULTISPECIES: hypothetical protein [unclassified Bifidobacterium]|uniref:VG15 protein n=1 Tax=unclassified Bifidobacterium TaxID=2608897 RepID=UPI00226B7226|nr:MULTISPECIES: hypothetical protein [unclassified Bifidobacterium]
MAGQDLPQTAVRQARRLRKRSNSLARRITLLWRANAGSDFSGSYAAIMPALFASLDQAQQATAADSAAATPEAMRELDGHPLYAQYPVDPRQWVGVDGAGYDTLDDMWGAVVAGKQAVRKGLDEQIALKVIEDQLQQRARTILADTSRSASAMAARSRRHTAVWVRALTPPSCGRCVILAGQPSGAKAFERHPRCDCIAVYATRMPDSACADPRGWLDRLDDRQLARTLGSRANARAYRDGADLNALVNAYRRKGSVSAAQAWDRRIKYTTESTTRRGYASHRMIDAGYAKDFVKAGGRSTRVDRPRLMPETIYQIAGSDHDKALRLLHNYGWLN